MTSPVFSSATRLLALLESFAGAPYRQVNSLGGGEAIGLLPSSLGRLYSMIMVEAITLIQARTSWIFSGVLHS